MSERTIALKRRYMREHRLRKLNSLKAPVCVIQKEKELIERSEKECARLDISEEEYQEFCEKYFLIFLEIEMSFDFMQKCLVYMRYVQENPDQGECFRYSQGSSCGPHCAYYQKPSEEQTQRFMYWENVDTGESLPIPPGIGED
jgi:hypothetical protein